jgi:GAF domain-containing protein
MTALPHDVVADPEREIARLRAQLRFARERQNASAEILRAIASTQGDAEQALRQIAEITARLFGAPSVSIRLIEGDEWGLSINHGANSKRIRAEVSAEQRRVGGRNLPGTVFRENRQIHIPDLDNIDPEMADWPVMTARAEGTRTVSGTPLRREGQPVGALIVFRDRLAPFTDDELALQQSFADQAVIAIENARLFNESKEALARQTATSDILKVIASSPSDVQPVFEAIAERSNRLLNGLSTAVYSLVDDVLHLMALTPISPEADAALKALFPQALSTFPFGEALRRGEISGVSDSEVEFADQTSRLQMARLRGWRSNLWVPLLRDKKPIGAISVTRVETGSFADHHVQLLQTFADQAVIAIENARLFNETEEALERQTATADILKVIASSPSDVQPVFQAIAESANRLVGGFSAAVFRFIDGMNHLAAFTSTGSASDEALKASFPRALSDFHHLELIREGEAVQFTDTEKEDVLTIELGRARGFRSISFTPLINHGAAIGMITVTRKEPGPFAGHHIQLLQTFADQAVIAIQNTRLFNETEEALERQAATSEVLKVISSSPGDMKPVFEAILSNALRICEAKFGHLLLYNGESFLATHLHDVPEAYREYWEQHGPIHPSPNTGLGRLLRTKQVAHIPDLKADSAYAEREPLRVVTVEQAGARSFLAVPMLEENKLIGAIVIYRKELRPFTDKHIELVKNFADQAVIAIENARLFNETQEALERQTATADILKVIASSPSEVQLVFDAIVERAVRLCGGRMGRVYRYDDGVIHMVAAHGVSAPGLGKVHQVFPRPATDDTIAGQVMASRQPYLVTDIRSSESVPALSRQMIEAMGTRSQVTVPMLRTAEPIGAITVGWAEPGAYGDQQVALLQTFADQAVIAIENARLFNETKEALERQTATADILKVIASSPSDVQPVFEAIATSSKRLIRGFSTTVFRFVDGVAHLAAFTPTNPAADDLLKSTFPRPVADFAPFALAQAGKVVQIADTENMEDLEVKAVARLRGFRSMLFSPLMSNGVPIGLVAVTRIETGSFAEHHVQLLQTFADQAVIAIENVRLFNEVQQRTNDLSESLQQQTATADVLKVISRSTFDLPAVLQTLVESAARLCDADRTNITREKNGSFYRAEAFGFSAEFQEYATSNPIEPGRGSAFGRALASGEAVHIADVLADPEYTYREGQILGNYRTVLAVPLLREGAPIGVLTLTRAEVRPFTDKQLQLAMTFADQAAIAIENVRLFDEVQAKTRDLQEALTYQTGSGNILKVIASSPTDVQPVLEAIVNSACELCEADDALVVLKEADDLVFRAQHGSIPVVWERQPISRQWASGRAVLDRRPVHVHDLLSTQGEGFPDSQELARRTDVRTVLSVPLLRENESIGAIVLRRTEVQPFSEKQIALLQTFADQAVIAIGNVRLFEEVQARTRELAASLDELRNAQDRLIQTEKLASLGQLTAGIAHEIKNPLNFINNFSALSAELTDELNEVLKTATLRGKIRGKSMI